MPYSRTRRQERLQQGSPGLRYCCRMRGIAVRPTDPAYVRHFRTPRFKGSGTVDDACWSRCRSGTSRRRTLPQILSRVDGREVGSVGENAASASSACRGCCAAWPASVACPTRASQSVEDDAVVAASVTPMIRTGPRSGMCARHPCPEAWNAHSRRVPDHGHRHHRHGRRREPSRPARPHGQGWDFHNNDTNPYDDDGHGTAVATTAARCRATTA